MDISNGLSTSEAEKRLEKYGPNEFEEKKEYSVWKLLLQQFMSPLIYVLLFAGGATLLLHEWIDATVIFLVVMVNSALGFYQEFKAAKSLEALKSYLKPKVVVRRDGKRQEILMCELVPGDIVLLDAGGSVPADGVVVSGKGLIVNEALLTGESRPVIKEAIVKLENIDTLDVANPQSSEAKNFMYMGTSVAGGIGEVLVLKTGHETQMGKIAMSLATTQEVQTPLQMRLSGLARQLMYVVVGATLAILVIGLLRGNHWIEMFETAIAVAVAAIPEGLVVSMTVILALGMQRILKRKALVRKLVAAETLGSVSVICSDKTGTLTEGKMRVVDFVGDRDELIRGAVFANDERDEEGLAMVEWAKKEMRKKKLSWSKSSSIGSVRKAYAKLDSVPFSSERKYAASLVKSRSGNVLVVLGAPEQLLKDSFLSDERKKKEQEKIKDRASKGYRLIGVATKNVGKEEMLRKKMISRLGWGGFLVFEDPVRSSVKQAIGDAMNAGVSVKVITGDYKETAMAVLSKLFDEDHKLRDDEVITGDELAKMSRKELDKRIGSIVLFARTSPDQKLVIVESLRRKGEVVAMTGDGVNDAPALKSSDIGVVVNEATDVSKQTADMVLLDSNFRTIVEAIREGRVIYETMKKIVVYLVSTSFQEIVLIGGSLLIGLPMPLTAIQVLWINLVQDGLPGVALAFESSEDNVMKDKPRGRKSNIIDREGAGLIMMIALVANLLLLSVFYGFLRLGFAVEYVQTMMFLGVGMNTLLFIFSIKSLRKNLWNQDLFDNKFLLFSVGVGFLLMFLSLWWRPLSGFLGLAKLEFVHVLFVLGINLVGWMAVEIVKLVFVKQLLDSK